MQCPNCAALVPEGSPERGHCGIIIAKYSAAGTSVSIIAEEEAETRRLAPEIAKIKRLNQQRQDLNARLDVITRLDRDRYFRTHLMDELNRSMPEHMWLTRFEDLMRQFPILFLIFFSSDSCRDVLKPD